MLDIPGPSIFWEAYKKIGYARLVFYPPTNGPL